MKIRLLLAVVALLPLTACIGEQTRETSPEPCSDQWQQYVEERLPTGDGQGHGPDVGSAEWRSVVEFKLGIRGNPEIPASDSPEWCAFIDARISEHEAAQ